MSELKPCPFCGDAGILGHFDDPEGGGVFAMCETCFAETFWEPTEQAAIKAWNTRAAPPGHVTEEECKRRCLLAVAMVLRSEGCTPSEYDKEHVEKWYAEHWGER